LASPSKDANKIYNIYIWCGAGSGHTADEGILLGVIASLNKEIPDARIRVFCTDPEYTKRKYNIETVPRLKTVWGRVRAYIKAFREADLIIWSGGVPFYDSAHLGKLFLFGLARLLGKPIMFYGAGAFPIRSKRGRLITPLIIKWSSAVTVRDKSSFEVLRELKGRREVVMTADPALFLPPTLSPRLEKELDAITGTSPKAPLIGICTGSLSNYHWGLMGVPIDVSAELISHTKSYLARVADFIASELGQVLFIPFFISSREQVNDGDIFKDIIELMERKDRATITDSARNTAQELAGVIGRLDLLLSGRLHGLVNAALSSVPMVAIEWELSGRGVGSRIRDFMENIGQENLVCTLEGFNYDDCLAKLSYAWSHRDLIRQEIKPKVEALKEKAALNARIARELLKQSRGAIQ